MSIEPLPSFVQITEILQEAELIASASEVHGILSGFICGGIDLDSKGWLTHFNDVVNEGMGLPKKAKQLVSSVHAQVISQFTDDGLGFNLLLPDDDKPLDDRCDSMSQWAQGFLVGFGMVQPALSEASQEIQELIKDIRDISQVSLDFEQEDEESEIAYAEIVEYLRVGAMLCFNHFSRKPSATSSKTIH
jgi:yecA family protein